MNGFNMLLYHLCQFCYTIYPILEKQITEYIKKE